MLVCEDCSQLCIRQAARIKFEEHRPAAGTGYPPSLSWPKMGGTKDIISLQHRPSSHRPCLNVDGRKAIKVECALARGDSKHGDARKAKPPKHFRLLVSEDEDPDERVCRRRCASLRRIVPEMKCEMSALRSREKGFKG